MRQDICRRLQELESRVAPPAADDLIDSKQELADFEAAWASDGDLPPSNHPRADWRLEPLALALYLFKLHGPSAIADCGPGLRKRLEAHPRFSDHARYWERQGAAARKEGSTSCDAM